MMDPVYIVDAVRIPRARSHPEKGLYAQFSAVQLLEPLFHALTARSGLNPDCVDDVLLGCATQFGDQGANIAKIAALYAGWPDRVAGITLNRFCCSGLDAINLAAAQIASGVADCLVAGGVEHISRVPMFSDKGAWFTDSDVMQRTGFMHMGLAADLIACKAGYAREQLDQLALQSHQRAAEAEAAGCFSRSLVPLMAADGSPVLAIDNAPRANASRESLAALPASFATLVPGVEALVQSRYPGLAFEARHSAGNAPALVDGASLVLLASESALQQQGLAPRARIRHFAVAADEPVQMLTGHVRATEKLLQQQGLGAADIDLWEVNESFAASVLYFRDYFSIANDRLNVNGSAIALGHPLGATGGNLMGTLVDELERRSLKRGLVAICGGAGVGVATLVERI